MNSVYLCTADFTVLRLGPKWWRARLSTSLGTDWRERGEVEIATAPPWGSRYRGNPWNAEKQLRLRATERARERERERVGE